MSYLLHTLAGNTIIAIALALLAILTMRLRKPALAHALWLLVLLKLITPAMIHAPVPADAIGDWAPEPIAAFADPAEDNASIGELAAAPLAPEQPVPPSSTATGVNWWRWASSIWLGGAVVAVMVALFRVVRFRRLLCSAAGADDALLNETGRLARRLGLDWFPDVRVVGDTAGPMIYFDATRRPILVVPAHLTDAASAQKRAAILSHELAHLRRGDHWVRLVELLVACALWWHPLVWLARRGLHEAEEQCCDAWVVHALPHARREYATALVDTIERYSTVATASPVTSGLGQLRHLKRRIIMIVTQTPSRTLSMAAKAVVALGILALPVAPGLVVRGQDAPATPAAQASGDKDQQIQELQKMINAMREELKAVRAELQATREQVTRTRAAVQDTQQQLQANTDPLAAPRAQIDANRAKARQRSAQDMKKYTRDQLQEAEDLYQVANKNWRSPEAKASLEKMVEKYPDINRTGCAVLYLGQYSRGQDRIKLMTDAYQNHGDCCYFNGVQVGPYARFLLALTLKEEGQPDEAKKLIDEVLKNYPNAIDHSGRSLAKVIEKMNAEEKS